MANAKVAGRKLYFLAGKHLVKIKEIKFSEGDKMRSGNDTFIVRGEIIETTNSDQIVGTTPAQVSVFNGKFPDVFWGNVKQFVAAALGTDPENPELEDGQSIADFWKEALTYMVSEEQPLNGQWMDVECYDKEKKNSPGTVTIHTWSAVTD